MELLDPGLGRLPQHWEQTHHAQDVMAVWSVVWMVMALVLSLPAGHLSDQGEGCHAVLHDAILSDEGL